jgi:hypothetical protein
VLHNAASRASFLGQLAAAGVQWLFTGLVAQACGQFPQVLPGRVAVLADQQHPLLIIDRHDGEGAGVLDDFTLNL